MDKEKTTLGGFEAILDSFIPNPEGGYRTHEEDVDDEELDNLKKSSYDPVAEKVKKATKVEEEPEDVEEDIDEEIDNEDDEPKRKPGRPKKETVEEETEESEGTEEDDSNVIVNFFDAMAEKLGWEFDEEESDKKPKSVEELINYFQDVIEENSKPEYASEEIEALDNFVKQGGDIKKYLTIEAEIDLDNIDIEDESTQKAIVKQLFKEKGFSPKKIEKLVSKYEEAGLLEDEAQDALEDLREIKEQKKEQLLKEQKKQYAEQVQRQQQFYDNVVTEIKGLKNIRGITVPEKDKKVLMDYILKPDTDGKTKYQKDYAKGGVKNLIESAYFTMNADKLLEAAKREGSNKAVEKFRRSLKTTGINGKSRQQSKGSDDEPVWLSAARQLRIS